VLTTNFARQPAANVSKPMFIGLSIVLAVLIVVIAWSIGDVVHMNASLPMLETRLHKAQESANEKSANQPPGTIDTEQWMSVKNRIDSMNQLLGRNGNNLSVIFARLADVLYTHVTLVSFKYQKNTGEIGIVVETDSDSELSLIHQKLQQEPIFKEVLLTRKINEQMAASKLKRYEFQMQEVAVPRL